MLMFAARCVLLVAVAVQVTGALDRHRPGGVICRPARALRGGGPEQEQAARERRIAESLGQLRGIASEMEGLARADDDEVNRRAKPHM
jgi:hypothetical protein